MSARETKAETDDYLAGLRALERLDTGGALKETIQAWLRESTPTGVRAAYGRALAEEASKKDKPFSWLRAMLTREGAALEVCERLLGDRRIRGGSSSGSGSGRVASWAPCREIFRELYEERHGSVPLKSLDEYGGLPISEIRRLDPALDREICRKVDGVTARYRLKTTVGTIVYESSPGWTPSLVLEALGGSSPAASAL